MTQNMQTREEPSWNPGQHDATGTKDQISRLNKRWIYKNKCGGTCGVTAVQVLEISLLLRTRFKPTGHYQTSVKPRPNRSQCYRAAPFKNTVRKSSHRHRVFTKITHIEVMQCIFWFVPLSNDFQVQRRRVGWREELCLWRADGRK